VGPAQWAIDRLEHSSNAVCGSYVIADDPRARHADAVRAAIEACDTRLLVLPTYSPDFNPIEHIRSNVTTPWRA
jgi:transposase